MFPKMWHLPHTNFDYSYWEKNLRNAMLKVKKLFQEKTILLSAAILGHCWEKVIPYLTMSHSF